LQCVEECHSRRQCRASCDQGSAGGADWRRSLAV
jgi:hypothetical protein